MFIFSSQDFGFSVSVTLPSLCSLSSHLCLHVSPVSRVSMSQCLVCFPLTVPCHMSAYLVSLLLVSLCVISPSCVFLLFPIPSLLPSTFLVSQCFVSSCHAQGFSLFFYEFWFMEDFLSNKAAALSSPFCFLVFFLSPI